ncbi:hypothetical protein Nepgr_031497 [Nepenthes gracilis]|uniref:Uncharacterized protein n=1 Tax=Nepenthes gracilis TaxID=150966 RepID=A0AAD3Y755_NEPGR|nr:hypothetical protein Nepgr_031497 [Nepenthes gracilis]
MFLLLPLTLYSSKLESKGQVVRKESVVVTVVKDKFSNLQRNSKDKPIRKICAKRHQKLKPIKNLYRRRDPFQRGRTEEDKEGKRCREVLCGKIEDRQVLSVFSTLQGTETESMNESMNR